MEDYFILIKSCIHFILSDTLFGCAMVSVDTEKVLEGKCPWSPILGLGLKCLEFNLDRS